MKGQIIVIFVEGATDKAFYDALIQFYRENSSKPIQSTKVINLKGIGRFENKVAAKIKHEFLGKKKYSAKYISVFCSYDTDVFELGKKPPTNWKIVKDKLTQIGVKVFKEIKAVSMIEDWFLFDKDGIAKFLKLKKCPSLKGKSGLEKYKRYLKAEIRFIKKETIRISSYHF